MIILIKLLLTSVVSMVVSCIIGSSVSFKKVWTDNVVYTWFVVSVVCVIVFGLAYIWWGL